MTFDRYRCEEEHPRPGSRHAPRRHVALAIAFALVAAILAVTPGTTSANDATAVSPINNGNRREVARTYRQSVEANLQLASQWTGSTSQCNPGSADPRFDAATIETINWFRSMAGLDNVVEDLGQSAEAQRAALMMDAQNYLSHTPAPSWACYSAAGASGAEKSNLTLGITGTSGVLGQIEDAGASNAALGHRRWLLFPRLETVGVGNTSSASAVHLVNNFGDRTSETSWVQWPPAGFVPDDVVFNRWSVSYSGSGAADFTNARVSVTENGRPLGVTVLPLIDGFGDPTLGFEIPGANPTAIGDTKYRVSITGIEVNGRSIEHNYTVTAFDARAASYACNGQAATIAGTTSDDVITGTSHNDVIVGLGGHDQINGLAGHDIICAGFGNDTIKGSFGDDVVFGSGGIDLIIGGIGNDILDGGAGRDQLFGQAGTDELSGGNGTDICWGETRNTNSSSGDSHRCEQGR